MNISKISKLPHLIGLRLKLRVYGVAHGKRIRGNRVIIKNVGKIIIGNSVGLNSFPGGEPYRTGLQTHCKDAIISIGDNCNLNGTIIHCRTKVEIGSLCMFGPGSKLVDNDSHRISIDISERRKSPNSAPIIIHDNVWVGMNSLILKGVEIGQNSIVAAHSVVTRNVPENTLVAGNPAKIIKTLTK
jgi:acetyltransferase-like isoleucine patch superfamily enzyme